MLDSNFWRKYFRSYDILNKAIPYQELLEDIIAAAKIKDEERVFDAGSGTGNLSILLKAKGAKVVSFDFSKEGLELHRRKDPSAETIQGDLTKPLPFADGAFDIIVSNNVIYTLDKKMRPDIFKEFYRVLKPGGRIIIANVHQGFAPIKIFTAHLRRSFAELGALATLKDLIRLGAVVIKMFCYNSVIKRENKSGSYDFMTETEQQDLLRGAGFSQISDNKITYAGQSYLNRAVKE